MTHSTLKTAYQHFADVAAPYLHIKDTAHYEATLALIEELMIEAEDDAQDPLNGLIAMLSQAVTEYENKDEGLVAFEKQAQEDPTDVAMLRLLMSQHRLGVADLPEIGDKSLVSRILSGSRNLTKQHIQKLSQRFSIHPGMFF